MVIAPPKVEEDFLRQSFKNLSNFKICSRMAMLQLIQKQRTNNLMSMLNKKQLRTLSIVPSHNPKDQCKQFFTEYLQNTCTPKLAEIESKFNELQSSCEQTLLAAQQEIQQREEYIFHKFEDMRNFQEQMQQIFNNVSNMQGYDTNQHQQNGDAQEVQEQPIVKQNILEE
eukprot:TRINITY_DN4789_c1_g1_i3.p2 TRINITY_DN4789_c1_g1~~TRINITY_DN4789_c1_g1_i3.p2  ORF type:complete len:170 (-),score=12.09 TRINITY_DN4789_c1_g1_i3:188-697(-)